MFTLLGGIGIFVGTAAFFWFSLPAGGQFHRFVGTEFEPYYAVFICSGVAIGFTMILSSVLDMIQ